MWRNEGRFLCITWVHWNLAIAEEGVQKRKHHMPSRGINDLIYSWQGEVVFRACFIEVCVVHAYPPFVALLRDDYYICKPFRILHLSDKTYTKQVVSLCLNNFVAIWEETPYFLPCWLCHGNHIRFMRDQCWVDPIHV